MIGPKDIDIDIDQDLTDFDPDINEFEDESFAVDEWGNEWDASGDFDDMDFRLVDD